MRLFEQVYYGYFEKSILKLTNVYILFSASIGQSMVALNSDAYTNISTFMTGAFSCLFIYVAYDVVNIIPLGAVMGIMTWGALKLVSWTSLLTAITNVLPEQLRIKCNLDYKVPRADTLIMLVVTIVAICVDVPIAILSGVFIAVFVHVWDSSTRVVVQRIEEDGIVSYHISGSLFYATADGFKDLFELHELLDDPEEVLIVLKDAEVHDVSGMLALKKVYDRFRELDRYTAITQLSSRSRRVMEKSAYMWQGVNFVEMESEELFLEDFSQGDHDHVEDKSKCAPIPSSLTCAPIGGNLNV